MCLGRPGHVRDTAMTLAKNQFMATKKPAVAAPTSPPTSPTLSMAAGAPGAVGSGESETRRALKAGKGRASLRIDKNQSGVGTGGSGLNIPI